MYIVQNADFRNFDTNESYFFSLLMTMPRGVGVTTLHAKTGPHCIYGSINRIVPTLVFTYECIFEQRTRYKKKKRNRIIDYREIETSVSIM